MEHQRALADEAALRMWAIEQAAGDITKAREIARFVKDGDGLPKQAAAE